MIGPQVHDLGKRPEWQGASLPCDLNLDLSAKLYGRSIRNRRLVHVLVPAVVMLAAIWLGFFPRSTATEAELLIAAGARAFAVFSAKLLLLAAGTILVMLLMGTSWYELFALAGADADRAETVGQRIGELSGVVCFACGAYLLWFR
jgi:hypothetical protein